MNSAQSVQPIQVRSLLVVLRQSPWEDGETALRRAFGAEAVVETVASPDGRMFVGFVPRVNSPLAPLTPVILNRVRLILGDTSEFDEMRDDTPMANAALVDCDAQRKSVYVLASIVGLPPLFLYEDDRQTLLTSDLLCLANLIPSGLDFDPEGVLDVCSYGFPIEHRTLFRNVQLVPGGSSLRMALAATSKPGRAWAFPTPDPLDEWEEYTELQIGAFLSTLRRMDVKNSFLSLTAGLDTRTIFAALISSGQDVQAYTLSGETPSLDARTAGVLCRAYSVSHEAIPLNAEFVRSLPDYIAEASRLSGGLASLGQAHQVYLYRKLPRAYTGRISGNMGNQLGRKGVEHVTMRAANPAVLTPELQKRLPKRPRFAWANQDTGSIAKTSHEFLFQQEYTFTQLGNYSIGNSFAVQQSPYASRDLIALCYREPRREEHSASMSPRYLRFRDLRHRFLGEPERYSFQRRLVHRIGGFAANYPINWGWRAKGGISVPGAFRGCLSAVDAYSERAGWDSGARGGFLQALRIAGLHEHRKPKKWLRDSLRDFTYDTLRSVETEKACVLDISTVSRMLDEHYSGRVSHYRALVLALDLALAAKNFRAVLR